MPKKTELQPGNEKGCHLERLLTSSGLWEINRLRNGLKITSSFHYWNSSKIPF